MPPGGSESLADISIRPLTAPNPVACHSSSTPCHVVVDSSEHTTCHQPRQGGEDPAPSVASDGSVACSRSVGIVPPRGDAPHSHDPSEAACSSESPSSVGQNSPPSGDASNSTLREESVSASQRGGGSRQSLADRLTALPPQFQASRTRGGQRRQCARLQALRFSQSPHQHHA